MIPMVKHVNLVKISDKVMWLNSNWVLKFAVDLAKKTNDGRQSYYSEFGYTYNNEYRVEISRDFNYYYIIESIKPIIDNSKYKFRILKEDIYFVVSAFKEALKWFTNEQYKALFVRNENGSVTFGMDTESIRIDLMYNSYIEIEPAISQLYLSDAEIGVHLYLG